MTNVFHFISRRSLYVTYDSTVTVKDIELYRFVAPDELYFSGKVYAPNKGFCVADRCLPTGLLDISRCQPMSKSRLTCWIFQFEFHNGYPITELRGIFVAV